MGFQSMDNALSGVLSYRRALDVVSQNISNASNEDYSRQRAELASNRPYQSGNLSIGRGVQVEGITRARDELLETRLRQETQNLNRYEQLESIYQEIENALNEPSENGIRGTLSSLNSSMQNLANSPENRGGRRSVIGQASTFANVLKRFHGTLQDIGGGAGESSVDAQINTTLDKINNIGEEIASLNMEINSAQAGGATPNDLLDKRNALTKELSQYIDMSVEKTSKSYRVNVSGYTLVQQGQTHELEYAEKQGSDKKQILYDDNLRSVIRPKSGQLKALIDLKEQKIPELIDQLNDMAVQFVDRFNDTHKAGFGLQGQQRNNFWQELPKRENGIFRLEGMGALSGAQHKQRAGFIDSPDTVLTGDGSTDQPENFEADSGVQANPEGTLVINGNSLDYDMSEDTIKDVINRINETDNDASAYLSAENRLVIKGAQENDYQLDQLRDTGLLLDKANILTVGGSNRIGRNSVDDASVNLVDAGANLEGDPKIDATTATGLDLAEGTLEFTSSREADFSINYDAREDSLQDIVDRVNTASEDVNSNITGIVTAENNLRLFTSNSSNLSDNVTAGNNQRVRLNDASGLSPGEEIRISDDSGSSEQAKITDVDYSKNEIVVEELSNNYNIADNAKVQYDDPESDFTVNDTPSQQLRAGGAGGIDFPGVDNTMRVADASKFNQGDEVILADNSPTGEQDRAEVTNVNLANDEITVNQISGDNGVYNPDTSAVRRVADDNKKRNLLSSLGMDRYYDSDDKSYEYAIQGEKKRPPIADQVAGLKVSEKIDNNPDLIAAAKGEDTDLDGIAEVSNGPGDGSNMYELSNLHSEEIMNGNEKSTDDHVSELTAQIGNDASLVYREKEAADRLVNQITDQVRSNSGVSLDEEMTKLVRYQQAYQASARVIRTVRTMSNTIMQVL